jgi:hypothetical protein
VVLRHDVPNLLGGKTAHNTSLKTPNDFDDGVLNFRAGSCPD